jgi:signal transduction histidine kinase
MQADHARPEHTHARLEDLWQHGVLDTPPEPEFDRLTQLAASLTGAPVALVSLVDECRQFFKSAVGLPEPWRTRRETPLTHSFCALVVQDHAPLIIEDARTDPRVADAARLKQILINLLGNAAKFTHHGTLTLTAGEVTWQETPALEFRVVDTGIGMNPEQLARLFQPFVQASKQIGATYGGTGLGLAISQRYARAMGGDVEARSEPGVGSEFVLRIPRVSPAPIAT